MHITKTFDNSFTKSLYRNFGAAVTLTHAAKASATQQRRRYADLSKAALTEAARLCFFSSVGLAP